MRDYKIEDWESRLKRVFDRIDDYLEEKYGSNYPIHPARAVRGTTSSKADDGLFRLSATPSTSGGSTLEPGYVIEIRMVTLTRVPQYIRSQIEEEAVNRLREELSMEFPDRELKVERDGQVYKISGDLLL